jgi:hypothetical protein
MVWPVKTVVLIEGGLESKKNSGHRHTSEESALAVKHELVVAKGTPQSSHELAPENATEDLDGQEDVGA